MPFKNVFYPLLDRAAREPRGARIAVIGCVAFPIVAIVFFAHATALIRDFSKLATTKHTTR